MPLSPVDHGAYAHLRINRGGSTVIGVQSKPRTHTRMYAQQTSRKKCREFLKPFAIPSSGRSEVQTAISGPLGGGRHSEGGFVQTWKATVVMIQESILLDASNVSLGCKPSDRFRTPDPHPDSRIVVSNQSARRQQPNIHLHARRGGGGGDLR